ncbi:UPF0481 protein [Spatholobus suberectus]|nr:UPF0481 protein [Spatholobus suberectus]
MNIKVDQLVLVMQDVLLLENQLPYPLLKLLWRDTNKSTLNDTMRSFLRCHHWITGEYTQKLHTATQYPPPPHLLHLQRTIILHHETPPEETNLQIQKNDPKKNNDMVTYRNIKELKAAGIGLKTSKTCKLSDISFSYGWLCSKLILPEFIVDDTTAATILNLIAYEMCPDFENDYGICSYVSFLDSLIDHPDDVKALRSERILLNFLGSDEEVANLFNTISTDLVPNTEKYAHLRDEIENHYNNKCRTWLALGYHTYFSNPWAIIAFHAAILGLALTLIQTWEFKPSTMAYAAAKRKGKKIQSGGSKIQRVAHHLRDRKHFAKYYSPKMVSFGPIHYGAPNLQLGEKYTQMWAATYIESTRQNPQTLRERIAFNIEYLMKDLFHADLFSSNDKFSTYRNQGFTSIEEMICWTLFVDGCALLHILKHAKLHEPHKMKVKVNELVLVMQDVLLLEKQLPYRMLKLLWRDTHESTLIQTMRSFLRSHHWASREDQEKLYIPTQFPPHTHLLHVLRTFILHDPRPADHSLVGSRNLGIDTDAYICRNIKELKAVGIGLKTSKTHWLRDISFSFGWLYLELILPEMIVDNTAAVNILNLIVYEMCPDFENDYEICSYMSFLDSLIDHDDDVNALRSERILLNSVGSDEEVVNLFNTIGTDLEPEMDKYACLRVKIKKHCKNKCKTWLALGYHT